jgi:hypothetical protein
MEKKALTICFRLHKPFCQCREQLKWQLLEPLFDTKKVRKLTKKYSIVLFQSFFKSKKSSNFPLNLTIIICDRTLTKYIHLESTPRDLVKY